MGSRWTASQDPINTLHEVNQMKRKKVTPLLILTALLTLSSCTTFSESTDPGNSNSTSAITTTAATTEGSISVQARELGEKARLAAEDALGITQNFLSGIAGQEINTDTFKAGWETLKEKLQSMAGDASTEEARLKINVITAELEAEVNAILERINSNESVQEITAAVSDFWKQAKAKIDELTR